MLNLSWIYTFAGIFFIVRVRYKNLLSASVVREIAVALCRLSGLPAAARRLREMRVLLLTKT